MKRILVAIIVLMFPIMLSAQVPDSLLVQFSGVVVTADSLVPVPFATVGIKSQWRGTITDFYGFFSFVAQKKDTIEFSALGFKKVRYIIPDSLKQNHYSLIQMMSRDTITLRGAVVYPWPTKEQFKSAFLALRVPDDAMSRAQKNLSRHEMTQAGKNIKMDGQANQMYAQSQEQSRLYYAGELPPNNWLNPFAWAQFIQSWKNGDFNTKKNDDGQ